MWIIQNANSIWTKNNSILTHSLCIFNACRRQFIIMPQSVKASQQFFRIESDLFAREAATRVLFRLLIYT